MNRKTLIRMANEARRMTILAVVKDVCPTVGVEIPSSVSGHRRQSHHEEMLAHANEIAQRIG